MALTDIEARDLLLHFVNSRDPAPTLGDLETDSFYDAFRSGKAAEDLPAVERVIANLKGSAQNQQ